MRPQTIDEIRLRKIEDWHRLARHWPAVRAYHEAVIKAHSEVYRQEVVEPLEATGKDVSL